VGMRLDVLRAIARAVKSAVASGLGDEDLYAIEKWFAASSGRGRLGAANAARRRAPSKRSR
jgi:hypothetical protein